VLGLVASLTKCPLCKGHKEAAEFRSASGDRVVRTCKSCRGRVAEWKKGHPDEVAASNRRQGPKIRALAKAWYRDNTDRAKASGRVWREANMTTERARAYRQTWLSKPGNKAKQVAWVSAWMKGHREKMHGYYKRWYVENQDTLRHISSHRARVYAVSDFTFEDWLSTLEVFGRRCAYCLRDDVKLTMDHVIPVSRGGSHTVGNIVPACKSCNSKKNNRPIFLMAGKAA
jgi:5-methylcytosine-specific restriction endonuclease McrA